MYITEYLFSWFPNPPRSSITNWINVSKWPVSDRSAPKLFTNYDSDPVTHLPVNEMRCWTKGSWQTLVLGLKNTSLLYLSFPRWLYIWYFHTLWFNLKSSYLNMYVYIYVCRYVLYMNVLTHIHLTTENPVSILFKLKTNCWIFKGIFHFSSQNNMLTT